MTKLDDNKFGLKDKFGYAFGDMGTSLIFGLVSSYSMVYYTDVLGIAPQTLAIMLLFLKIFDGVIDPFLGMFMDSRRPTKSGKFKKYMLIFTVPVAAAGVLMFIPFKDFGINLSNTQAIAYAGVTYVLYVITYSSISVPYGSLASVITDDQKGRSSLSTFRTLGAGLGGLPAAIILPSIIYKSFESANGKMAIIQPKSLFYCVIVMSILCVVALVFSYKMTTERIRLPETKEKTNIAKTLKSLMKNRPFIIISLASLLLIMYTTYNISMMQYLGKDYFGNKDFITLASVCTYAPYVLLLPFLSKLIVRFGKKEVCAVGLFIAAAAHLILYLIQTESFVVYLIFLFISGLGSSIFTLQVWALVADVIDYQELVRGKREEGTTFSIYFFIRTFGNALSLFFANTFLGKMGYVEAIEGAAQVQTQEVIKGIYNVSANFPAVCCLLMAVLLFFFYPLNKREANSLKEKLREHREQRGIISESVI